ncbi:MAG TPA: ThiF family adenylyltransferase [Mycobacteriales bacterium]|nr:ThiF family adenylyltransferase [Mycobacteriales bacterium]
MTISCVRPALLPARRLWRDSETLQLGQPPGPAVVLAGVDPPLRRLLALLDGSRDSEALLAQAAQEGCGPARAAQLLSLLDEAGLLMEAGEDGALLHARTPDRDQLLPDVAALRLVQPADATTAASRRLQASVVVIGAGRVGAAVLSMLAAAGVGTVGAVDPGTARPADASPGGLRPTDSGRRRGDAAHERARGAAPGARVAAVEGPDLVVIAPVEPGHREQASVCLAEGTPHLLAEVRGAAGVVGPLVLPGRSACLHCLDLERTDRDPGWPALAVQLAQDARGVEPCDGALAAAVTAQAALQALAYVDGVALPATVGGSLELCLPDWRWRRRSWAVHPDCGCAWAA